MKENLPEFFGFEAVGVLIYNFESKFRIIFHFYFRVLVVHGP
jgi:hypothetical protein